MDVCKPLDVTSLICINPAVESCRTLKHQYTNFSEDTKEQESNEPPVQRNKTDIFGFLMFAVVTYIFYSTLLISAQDILASTAIPSTSILLCLTFPYLLMTVFLPYFIDNMSLMQKAVGSAVFFGLGFLLIALIETPAYRLFGVVVSSLGMGTAEIGFLSATSLHESMAIHSFTCGTGLGAVIGTTYFSGITTVLCVKPTTALLLLMTILPVFPLIAWLVKRKNSARHDQSTARGGRIEFTLIKHESPDDDKLTWREKFIAAKDNLYLAVPIFIGLFADYLTMQAIVTTLAYESSPFDPRDHFQYYQQVFWLSEIIGRSYGLVIIWFKPECQVVTSKTWFLSTIIALNMVFLLLESWYRFFDNVWGVMVVVGVTGAAEGALYLNTFAVAGINDRPRYKEFSRAFLTLALQGGIVTAGLIGFVIEPHVRAHCKGIVPRDDLCATRLSQGQWNATSSCITH